MLLGFKGERRKILIVDDNPQNRSLLTNMLTPLGFDVQEAVNGQNGLEKTIQFEPHLILIDLRMPVMDGFETIRRIRELPTGQDIVIITISATVFENKQQKSNQ